MAALQHASEYAARRSCAEVVLARMIHDAIVTKARAQSEKAAPPPLGWRSAYSPHAERPSTGVRPWRREDRDLARSPRE